MPLKKANKIRQSFSTKNEERACASSCSNIDKVVQQPANEQLGLPQFFDSSDMESIGVPHPNTVRALLHADSEPMFVEHIVWGSAISDDASSLSSKGSSSLRTARDSNSTGRSRARRRSAEPTRRNQVLWHLQDLSITPKDVQKLEKRKIRVDDISVIIDTGVNESGPSKGISETCVLSSEASRPEGQPMETCIIPSQANRPQELPTETCVLSSQSSCISTAHALPEPKHFPHDAQNMHQQIKQYLWPSIIEPMGEASASESNKAPSEISGQPQSGYPARHQNHPLYPSWLARSTSPARDAEVTWASGSNKSLDQLQLQAGQPAKHQSLMQHQFRFARSVSPATGSFTSSQVRYESMGQLQMGSGYPARHQYITQYPRSQSAYPARRAAPMCERALVQRAPEPSPPLTKLQFAVTSDQDDDERDDTLEKEFSEYEEMELQRIAHAEFLQVQRPNLQILRTSISYDHRDRLTSIGSIDHRHRDAACKPCVHIMCKTVCPSGIDCSFCQFPHRKPGKQKKLGKNDRYRKLVDNLVDFYEKDPDRFVLDEMQLPPSIQAREEAVDRLAANMQERMEFRRLARLTEALHDLREFDSQCAITQIITASGRQATLALVSL